jgi:cell wall-associated NlpC family hydrolase
MVAIRIRNTLLPTLLALGLGACSSTPPQPEAARVGPRAADHALRMVGVPYRYGGSSPRGFDCSGLVQYSYARAGARLPRNTQAQRAHSRPVSQRQLRRGDLLFFNQEGKRASHVGIYLGNNRFVHAPSSGKSVYVADFTDPYWRRHFHEARRPLID